MDKEMPICDEASSMLFGKQEVQWFCAAVFVLTTQSTRRTRNGLTYSKQDWYTSHDTSVHPDIHFTQQLNYQQRSWPR
jgi:hypothetical protein